MHAFDGIHKPAKPGLHSLTHLLPALQQSASFVQPAMIQPGDASKSWTHELQNDAAAPPQRVPAHASVPQQGGVPSQRSPCPKHVGFVVVVVVPIVVDVL